MPNEFGLVILFYCYSVGNFGIRDAMRINLSGETEGKKAEREECLSVSCAAVNIWSDAMQSSAFSSLIRVHWGLSWTGELLGQMQPEFSATLNIRARRCSRQWKNRETQHWLVKREGYITPLIISSILNISALLLPEVKTQVLANHEESC